MTGPQRQPLTAKLRDTHPCRTEWGGCGATPGQPCRTRNGQPTQPHEARWQAARQAPARPPAPVTAADPDTRHSEMLDLAAALITEAQALLAAVASEQRQARNAG